MFLFACLFFLGNVLAAEDESLRFILTQREISDRKYPSQSTRCPITAAYYDGVLKRLLVKTNLMRGLSAEPAIRLAVQCSGGPPLPVARAVPGRVIVVPPSLALLAQSEDAIAAVLAHELAHIGLRHVERLREIYRGGRNVDVSAVRRHHEREADLTGLRLLANAGYDPAAAVDHLLHVESIHRSLAVTRASISNRHDSPQERREILIAEIKRRNYAVKRSRMPMPVKVRDELRVVGNKVAQHQNSPFSSQSYQESSQSQ